jgi:hypothetical protein
VEEKVAALQEMVSIYRNHLRLDVMVINTYNDILALDPGNDDALTSLAQVYESMNRWNDLIDILGRQAETCADLNQRKALLRRIAQLWVDRFVKRGRRRQRRWQ